MPDTSTDVIISVAAQIPIVVAFIWFVLKIMRLFLEYLKLHDSDWKVFFDQMTARWSTEQGGRDLQWRTFLDAEQKRSVDAYAVMAEQLKHLVSRVDGLSSVDFRRPKKQGED